jgi:hypothetical protein
MGGEQKKRIGISKNLSSRERKADPIEKPYPAIAATRCSRTRKAAASRAAPPLPGAAIPLPPPRDVPSLPPTLLWATRRPRGRARRSSRLQTRDETRARRDAFSPPSSTPPRRRRRRRLPSSSVMPPSSARGLKLPRRNRVRVLGGQRAGDVERETWTNGTRDVGCSGEWGTSTWIVLAFLVSWVHLGASTSA